MHRTAVPKSGRKGVMKVLGFERGRRTDRIAKFGIRYPHVDEVVHDVVHEVPMDDYSASLRPR